MPVLRAVATDGHRLARVQMPLPSGAAGMPAVIVPRKAVQEIRKLIEETDGDVQVSLNENKLRVALDGSVLTTKLIDGTFPDYERRSEEHTSELQSLMRNWYAVFCMK